MYTNLAMIEENMNRKCLGDEAVEEIPELAGRFLMFVFKRLLMIGCNVLISRRKEYGKERY